MRLLLLVFASVLVTSATGETPLKEVNSSAMIESSDNWGMYLSDMGGHPALTVFDDGISERIDKSALPQSIKVKLHLNDVGDDGLPTSAEGERLMRIGPIIEDAIAKNGGLFLGRVTTNSVRWNLGLVPEDASAIERALIENSETHDFQYDVFIESDANKSVYWEDLYPTDDDRQVMADMDVQRALSENGDYHRIERPIDHFTYFDRQQDADRFARWSQEQDYSNIEVIPQKEGILTNTRWLVRMKHDGTTLINDISYHSIKLSNQAREYGGHYDGWGTFATQ